MIEAGFRTVFLRINPQKIYYLKFILEGYDGLGVLTTIDRVKGIIVVRYPEPVNRYIFKLLDSIACKLAR